MNDPADCCELCNGDGYVEVGDRWVSGSNCEGLQACAVDCPCSGGDVEDLPEQLRDRLPVVGRNWV